MDSQTTEKTTGRSDGSFLRSLEFLADSLLILLGYYGAFQLRYGFNPDPFNTEPFYALVPLIGLLAFGVLMFTGSHSGQMSGRMELLLHLTGALLALAVLTAAAAFALRGFSFPRSVFVISFALQMVLLYLWKITLMKLRWRRTPRKQTMIIGPKDEVSGMLAGASGRFHREFALRYVAGGVNDRVLDGLEDCAAVFLCPGVSVQERTQITTACLQRHISVHLVPDLLDVMVRSAPVDIYGDMASLHIEPLGLSLEKAAVKRALDLTVGGLLLLLAVPLMMAAAVMVLREDGWPVLFRQERVTRGGRRFTLLKFRTMVKDAEDRCGPVLASRRDPRVLEVGRMLRDTRIDELPQLINVLRGDMSLVGPRPERPHFVKQYEQSIPGFGYRLAVKAGITGLAQTAGRYATTPRDKLRLDLLYIRSQSLLMDLRILGTTLQTVLERNGSAAETVEPALEDLLAQAGGILLDVEEQA